MSGQILQPVVLPPFARLPVGGGAAVFAGVPPAPPVPPLVPPYPDVAPAGGIEPVPDYVAQGLGLLIDQYKNKPILAAVLTAFLNRANDLEVALKQVLNERSITRAVGIQLDILGKLVGQPRIGANDDIYRVWLLGKIRANRSRGRSIDIVQLAQIVLQGLAFSFYEVYPAAFVVDVRDAMTVDSRTVAALIQLATGAGINSSIQYSLVDEAEAFTFSSTDDPEFDAARGLSDDLSVTGGSLVDVAIPP